MVADVNVTRSGDGLALPDENSGRAAGRAVGAWRRLVVTVEADAAAVERRLAAGGIACPDWGLYLRTPNKMRLVGRRE